MSTFNIGIYGELTNYLLNIIKQPSVFSSSCKDLKSFEYKLSQNYVKCYED